ncbi:tol-pal system YbgF family protein [Streptomyces sp. NPDC127051]|uniref:tetratricopeptide repeat protein n=1 Tax=Streptomyces sp. NPDC127051 TaxID=3347119 RepID=UPI00366002ED
MPTRAGGVPAGTLYRLAALDEVLDEASKGIAWSGTRPAGGRIGKDEADAAHTALLMFSSADKSFGGGYIRATLAAYLTTVIDPWLKAPSSPAAARDLRCTAAQLTCLCAFVHFDDMKHGLAQRYYIHALDLADSADDELTTAVILRGLSVQAYTLGHYPQARRLAQAAHDRCPPWAPGYLRAALLGQRAVTASAFKETRPALEDLASAERHLHGAEEPTAPVGAYHKASLAHQRAETALQLKDFKNARTAFSDALRHRPPSEQRAHALILHKLATLELSQGQLEVACHHWQQLLHNHAALHSCRADETISEMRSLLRPFSRNAMAASLLRSAAQSSRVAR